MQTNCQKIWGSETSHDINIETEDFEYYICYVTKDYGDHFRDPLVLATSSKSPDAAWEELDRMLAFGARKAGKEWGT